MVDPQAQIQLSRSYTPFGEELTSSGSYVTPYAFAGEQQDASGLLYLRARYLSTSTGRFTSVAPFSGYLNHPTSMNPYQYAYNNPLRCVDRTGEWVIPALIIGSGVVAGVIEAYTQYQKNGCIDWGKVGIAALAGAGAMAVGIFVGWAVVTGGAAIFGESLLATIFLGVGSGIISGQVSRLTANLILRNPWNEGLGNPKDILVDGLLGGAGGAVGYGLGKLKESNFIIFNKTHSGSQPSPKGYGPNGGALESHHPLQKGWANKMLAQFGYKERLAPTVTIEAGSRNPHAIITKLQNQRRLLRIASGKGAWGSSLQEELQYIVDDFIAAGFSKSTIRKVLEQQYKMLEELHVPFERIKIK